MAVSFTVVPASRETVMRRITFDVTSDRDSADPETVSAVADNGSGKARFTTGTTHAYKVGDIITNSDFTDTSYNGNFEVTAIAASTYDVSAITFVATDTGNVVRLNANFQIRADIKKGITVLAQIRQLSLLSPVGTYRFDLSEVLATELSGTFANLGEITVNDIITGLTRNSVGYTVDFVEEFDDADGLLKEGDTITSPDKDAFNIAFQYTDNPDVDKFVTGSVTKRFMTSAPANKLLRDGEHEQLTFITDESSLKVRRNELDASGTPTVTFSASKTITGKMGIVVVRESQLLSTTVSVGYQLYKDDESTIITEERFFKVDRTCERHFSRIHFANREGGFDSFTFTGTRVESIKNKKTSFSKRIADDSGLVAGRGRTVLGVKSTNPISIWSEFLNDTEAQWLKQLLESPSALIQLFLAPGSPAILAINIENRNDKYFSSEKIGQIKLVYSSANDRIVQSVNAGDINA